MDTSKDGLTITGARFLPSCRCKGCRIHYWFFTVLLAANGFVSQGRADEPAGTCWVAAMAMNQEKEFSEDWNQFAEETALVFKKQRGEVFEDVNARTVVGRDATLPAIREAVRWAFTSARHGDLVVVHIGCHGGTAPKTGWSIDTMDGQAIYGRDLKTAAANVPCPVLFVIDTCGSGGFARDHDRDVPLPDNCVAVCSSRARQSTTNVLNMALNEALWGAADGKDEDDFVDLTELTTYVQQRCHRIAPPEESAKDSEVPVIVVGSRVASATKLTKRSSELVAVLHERKWYLARRVSEEGDLVRVHAMGYQDNPTKGFFLFNEAPRRTVFDMEEGLLPAMVIEGESTGPALVVRKSMGKVTIKKPLRPRQSEVDVDRGAVRYPFPIDR